MNLDTVEYIRHPGNSLDKQMPRFSLPFGKHGGLLPHEDPNVIQQLEILCEQKVSRLMEKYKRYKRLQKSD